MTRRRRRDDYLDSRLTQRAVDLFRLAKTMLRQGYSLDASAPVPSTRAVAFTDPSLLPQEYKTLTEVSRDLDRELGLRPWMPSVLDFEVYAMEPSRFPPHADFGVIEELHRQLAEAA